MTIADCIKTAMRWIDQATVNGTPCSIAFTADFEDRMSYLLDSAVSLVETIFPIHRSHNITQNIITPTFGFFEPRSFRPPNRFEARGGLSYTFEVSGDVTIVIDGVETKSDTHEFVRFSGEGDSIEIYSEYPFMVRGFATYNCKFKEIPEHRYWIPCKMPEDFSSLDRILFSGDGVNWENFSNYRFEDEKTFLVPYNRVGQFKFQYLHRHKPILPGANKGDEIDVDPKALPCVPLRLAIEVTSGVEEMEAVNQYLNARFVELTGALNEPTVGDYARIETVFHV